MSPLLRHGLDLILYLQQFRSDFLDGFFAAITFLGSEYFYLLAVPILYWCFNRRLAIRIGILILISGWINFDLKALFMQPRPFEYMPEVGIYREPGYALPSGHAQLTLSVYGYFARVIHSVWFYLSAALVVFLIGLSRVYLGVHFPSDVLAGWFVGIVVLALFLRWAEPAAVRLGRLPDWGMLLLCYSVCAGLFFLFPEPHAFLVVALFTGLSAGLIGEKRWIRFSETGSIPMKLARAMVGLLVIVLLYGGLKLVLPGEAVSGWPWSRFVRYWFVGFSVTLAIPALFVRLGLASRLPQS
ncbi:phosphatase PAP2 family protein [candidate division KSB1 bacterium]|nr:phosphatase PAP2 family protein [candidate division KSB1 bacterium]